MTEKPLTFLERVEQETNPEELKRWGIEARQLGHYDMSRKFYERSMEVGDGINKAENMANLCDLDRLAGKLEKALKTADEGLASAQEEAGSLGVNLEKIDSVNKTEANEKVRRLWFAYAKLANFKALTLRASFDNSGSDFSLLRQAITLNGQALSIVENLGHGFYRKVVVDLLSDRVASKDGDDWEEAIEEAGKYMKDFGPEQQCSLHSIRGKAACRLGRHGDSAKYHQDGLKVAEGTGWPRYIAGRLLELAAALCRNGQIEEAEEKARKISFGDLAEPDFVSFRADLEEIQKHFLWVTNTIDRERPK